MDERTKREHQLELATCAAGFARIVARLDAARQWASSLLLIAQIRASWTAQKALLVVGLDVTLIVASLKLGVAMLFGT
jgi:hypothetical protein